MPRRGVGIVSRQGVFVLGVDPGLRNCGLAVVQLLPRPARPRLCVLRHILQKALPPPTDKARRTRALYRSLRELADHFAVKVVCVEAFSAPRSSSASAKYALAFGAVVCVAEELEVPLLEVQPKELKRVVTGRESASKAEVQEALRTYFGASEVAATGVDKGSRQGGVAPSNQDHVWDAAGAIVASLPDNTIRMARALLKGDSRD